MQSRCRWYLIPSPLLGPATWRGVADQLSGAGHEVLVATTSMTTPSDTDHVSGWIDDLLGPPIPDDDLPVIVVGHSAACPRIPLAAASLAEAGWNVTAFVCVDGRFPDGRPFTVSGPHFGELLDGLVRPDDYVPPWPRWWGSLIEGLVIDPEGRAEVFGEARPVPRAWFDQGCPVPPLPSRVKRGFVSFGVGYQESCDQAEREGWLTRRLDGDHLHLVVAPDEVSLALVELLGCR